MSRFQANCLRLFALICLMAFGSTVNAGCYSGRATLGQRLAERRLERAENQLARAEARFDQAAVRSTSCFDSASVVTNQVYVTPVTPVVASEQSAKAEVCEKESCTKATESVTLKTLPAPVYSVVVPLQTLSTTIRTRTTVTGSGLQLFRAGSSCSTGGCR